MARNYSELAILEGNDNCIPIRLNGIVVDVPRHYFNTNLYNVKDVLDHEDENHLNGIAEHFEREGLMIGDDGFVYASLDPDDKTLSGDDYEPIGLLHGEDLELAGFKFKIPKFKMPGKKGGKGKGQLVKTRSGTLKAAGNLATKGFRTFNPIGMMGKQGLIGRNLKNLKNPFKGFKIGNPFKKLKFGKGGKGGSGMMDALTQMQEMQAQQQSEMPEEEIEEEVEENTKYIGDLPSGESDYSDDSQSSSDYSEDGSSEESQSDYSDDSQSSSDYSEDGSSDESQSDDAQEVGSSSDLAFTAANTALSFIPGGNIASGFLSQGKGIYDQQKNQKAANKQAVSQQRIALLQNLIKKNPKKKVVVRKSPPPPPPQLVKPTQVKQSFSSKPLVRNTQTFGTETKKDNTVMYGLAALAAIAAVTMSGSGKE